MKKIWAVLFIPLFLFANEKLNVYTENYPPYNYEVNNKLKGLSIEVLDAMSKKMGEDIKPTLTNWSRGYTMTLKRKDSVIFSTTRTQSREKLFKWVGPICKTELGLIAKKDKNIIINKLEDIKNYKTGTILKDIGEVHLLDNGIEKKYLSSVSGTNAIELTFKKLEKNRIDLFSYDVLTAMYGAKANGFDTAKYEKVFTLANAELYFAFNLDTDEKIIQKWQDALDAIRADGTYKKILEKYEK